MVWAGLLLVNEASPISLIKTLRTLWVADKTNPAVHAFDMSVLAALHAEWLAPMMGIA